MKDPSFVIDALEEFIRAVMNTSIRPADTTWQKARAHEKEAARIRLDRELREWKDA